MPKTNESRRAEWQRRGYLQKGRSGKMVEAFGLLLCVNFSCSSTWQKLEADGMVRTHFLTFSRIDSIGSDDQILRAYSCIIGPLSFIFAKLKQRG